MKDKSLTFHTGRKKTNEIGHFSVTLLMIRTTGLSSKRRLRMNDDEEILSVRRLLGFDRIDTIHSILTDEDRCPAMVDH